VQFTTGTLNLGTGLYFVRTLALCCQVLLYSQVDGVIIRLDAEDFFRKLNSSACFFALYA
jgi:hypothetical protein